ncbi:MAG: YdeI/OmpD-associated family protein [Acidobacteria bacterium]|nr:YdeI/OmpD-associated family protein [Acidobacteriota bacterium]MBV9474932.1 YdeI/OmpD-associated family protein [Acidobacteriota bacterium]
MGQKSKEVDAYIANAAPFARPILERIRRAFHEADPDLVETIKWRNPTFEHDGILGAMSAHKQHVNWGFWLELANEGLTRVHDVSELPSEEEIVARVKNAMKLRASGAKLQRAPRKEAAPVDVPDDLAAALKKHAKARATFEQFPPSHRREYIQWITEAKQAATREKRIATTLEWLAEGKPRNWKYMKK